MRSRATRSAPISTGRAEAIIVHALFVLPIALAGRMGPVLGLPSPGHVRRPDQRRRAPRGQRAGHSGVPPGHRRGLRPSRGASGCDPRGGGGPADQPGVLPGDPRALPAADPQPLGPFGLVRLGAEPPRRTRRGRCPAIAGRRLAGAPSPTHRSACATVRSVAIVLFDNRRPNRKVHVITSSVAGRAQRTTGPAGMGSIVGRCIGPPITGGSSRDNRAGPDLGPCPPEDPAGGREGRDTRPLSPWTGSSGAEWTSRDRLR